MTINELAYAVQKGLADHLQAGLVGAFPDVSVLDDWPAAGYALAPHTVAIQAVGAPVTLYHAPTTYNFVPQYFGTSAARYTYGQVELDLQLDLWTLNKPERRRLCVAVEALLNLHPAITLGTPGVFTVRYRRRAGVVLRLTELLDMLCDFRFDATPSTPDTGDAAQRTEWRASWSGRARMWLATEEQVATLRQLTLTTSINGDSAEDSVRP